MTAGGRARGKRNTGGSARVGDRSRTGGWVAGGLAVALIATVAVVSAGYDSREAQRADPSVWVARDAGQYARVNTDTGELDTVRKVAEPSGVIQSGGLSAILSHGNGRAWPIAAANPVDFGARDSGEDVDQTHTAGASGEESGSEAGAGSDDGLADAGVGMPEGTRDVVTAGSFVAVRTESGEVFAGELPDEHGGSGSAALASAATAADAAAVGAEISGLWPVGIGAEIGGGENSAEDTAGDPGADGAKSEDSLPAAAIAVSEDGLLGVYLASENEVRRFDLVTRAESGTPLQLSGEAAEQPQLARAGADWVVLDSADGRLLRVDAEPVEVPVDATPLLQASTERAHGSRAVLIADEAGLLSVARDGTVTRIIEAAGAPARPSVVGRSWYGAWLGAGSGSLWAGEGTTTPLQFDDSVRDEPDLAPIIRTNGTRGVLSDSHTGMVWTLPEGALIPLSQWSMADPPKEVRGQVVVDEVTDQVPPTAVDDAFGARAGEPAPLPVLLNDYDANTRDVLTIDAESLAESPLPADFGALELLPDRQSLVIRPSPGAKGSASFSYRVTDGVLLSEPATVTVTIAADDVNTAPEWCPVEGCQRTWDVPAIVPGGTLVAPLLDGWVDAEGDVITLAGVVPTRADDPVRAMVTADGRLAMRHIDPNAESVDVDLAITVRDSRGAEQVRELAVAVRPDASPVMTGTAATVAVGEPLTLTPLERVAGGSGAFALVDAVIQAGSAVAVPHSTANTVEVTASEPGVSTLAVTVRDTVTGSETTGSLRVTAVAGGPALALPPLRAFVRPLADSTVEVLDAVPGGGARPLTVTSAAVVDGELRADVMEQARVRVAGSTEDGAPGRIGAVDVTIAEEDATAQGRLTVFQVPEAGGEGVIAVADAATVRAGSTVDIRVLDNDVSAPGERLLLHPEVTGSGTKGELAFAAGGTVRYLAPQKPGTYRLGYTAYGAGAPELSDAGEIYVTVVAAGPNRAPQPATVTARVAPGASTTVLVPTSGVDPDGDRVRLRGVSASEDPRVSASLSPVGTGVELTASAAAEAGTYQLSYRVSDGAGETATGKLYVVVATDAGDAPIAVTDQVRLPRNGETVLQPLDNDADPAGGKLKLVSVTPNTPSGADSPEYRALEKALDTRELKNGRVGVRAGSDLGSASYRYVVRSEATSSTAEGLIVVHTSARVGAQAPAVSDTVLNVRDRSALSGRGIDVLTGKVRWPAGDPATLKLSLWEGTRGDYRVVDSRIRGEYDPAGGLVPFRVTGTDASGLEVTSYGFLVIPPLDELRLTLKPGLAPLSVDEGESVQARVSDLIDLGPGDRIELRDGAFSTARNAASCTPNGNNSIQYRAGDGAPWSDVCLMSARLSGQSSWTALAVPVSIVPRDPAVELNALTRTVSPGQTESIKFADMVDWQGGRDGDLSKLRFVTSGGGAVFSTTSDGSSLRVDAAADAKSGAQETVTVSASGAGTAQASLTLRVGEVPKDLPKGGTVGLQCTVGSACSVAVIGLPGEHDPFAGKTGGGLKLSSVDAGSCPVANFAPAGDRQVAVTWSSSATGGTCTVGFTVRDAQGRTGTGAIEFDAQGLPDAPTSIEQTGFTDSTATFRVALGGRQAHPEITGVQLAGGGSTSCAAEGPAVYQCVASGLANGVKHAFTARAVNAVGESGPSNAVTAWAYRSPSQPTVTATPLPDKHNTDQGSGSIRIKVSGSQDTREFQVSIGGVAKTAIAGPSGSADYSAISAGSQQVVVTPMTALELPPVGAGSASGSAAQVDAQVIGAPPLTGATLTSTGENSAKVEPTGASGGDTVTWSYGIALSGTAPTCTSGDPKFTGLERARWYAAVVCASSKYGVSTAVSGETQVGGAIPVPTASYTIGTNPTPNGAGFSYELLDGSAIVSGLLPGAKVRYSSSGGKDLVLDPNDASPITVQQCFTVDECSDPGPVTSTNFQRPITIVPRPPADAACVPGENLPSTQSALRKLFTVSGGAGQSASYAAGAATATNLPVTVTWTGAYSSLEAVTMNVCVTPPRPDPGPPDAGPAPDPASPDSVPATEP